MSGPEKDKRPVRSGQVRHDSGGRAIWEWALDSGRHAIDSTSRLLKKLDLTSLRLIGDDEAPWKKEEKAAAGQKQASQFGDDRREVPTFGGEREQDPLANERRGFNPYDSRTPTGRGAATPSRPKGPPRPRITQPVRPAQKPGLLGRLFGKK